MKRTINIILSLFVTIITSVGLMAGPSDNDPVFDTSAPTVPAEVLVQGRQVVTTWLLERVDSVQVEYHGKSLLYQGGRNWNFLPLEQLQERGYVTPGSFAELSQAVAGIGNSFQLMPLPQGGFDVQARVTFYSKSRQTVLKGSAWFNFEKADDGELVGTATVYVDIPSNLNFRVAGFVWDTRLITHNWGDAQQLPVRYDEASGEMIVQVPATTLWGRGVAAVSHGDQVTVLDGRNGTVQAGRSAAAYLAGLYSGSIIAVSSQGLNADGFFRQLGWFYQSDGAFYGRFPVVELAVGEAGINQVLNLLVPIQNTEFALPARRVQVKVLRSEGYPAGQVFDLDQVGDTKWSLELPSGSYQIMVEFWELLDWDQDPNPKG